MEEELKQPDLEHNGEGDGAETPHLTPTNERFKWYILHAYSGFERKVKESIESRIQAFGLQDRVGKVMIPMEPVTESKLSNVAPKLKTLLPWPPVTLSVPPLVRSKLSLRPPPVRLAPSAS